MRPRVRLAEMLKLPQPNLWDLANAYATAGMADQTLSTLQKCLAVREAGLLQLRVDPDFDLIRADPRYADLIRQIAFPNQ